MGQQNHREGRVERGFMSLFEANPVPSALVRKADQRFVAVNRAYADCVGCGDVIGLPFIDAPWLADSGEREQLIELVTCDDERDVELRVHRATGGSRSARASFRTVDLDGEPHTLVILNDVTAQRASEDRFAKAFAASPMPQVMIRAADRTFIAANDAFERSFGYSRA